MMSTPQDLCAICMEPKRYPVKIACGHTFCRICIARLQSTHREYAHNCPLCRKPFRGYSGIREHLPRAAATPAEAASIAAAMAASMNRTTNVSSPPAPSGAVNVTIQSIDVTVGRSESLQGLETGTATQTPRRNVTTADASTSTTARVYTVSELADVDPASIPENVIMTARPDSAINIYFGGNSYLRSIRVSTNAHRDEDIEDDISEIDTDSDTDMEGTYDTSSLSSSDESDASMLSSVSSDVSFFCFSD